MGARLGLWLFLNNPSAKEDAQGYCLNWSVSSFKAYPNSSTELVTMEFVLNVSAKATLDIMNVSGARVARLFVSYEL